jgi:hypothetical protein
VTPTGLRLIIATELEDAQVAAFIRTAHVMVQETLASRGLSEERLAEIDLWLAAHYLAISDQRPQQEKIGSEYAVTYQGQTGQGLQATLYGQQVLLLDTTGALANLGKPAASIEVF